VRFDRLTLGPTHAAERAVEALLAGPLPESIGRSLAEHQVVERVAAGMLDGSDGHREDRSAAAIEELTERLVHSAAFKRALTEVLSSPEVRAALTSQTTSFAEELEASARRGTRSADLRLQGLAGKLIRRRPAERSLAFGGFATRGVALVIDAALAQLAFVVTASSIALVVALAGGLAPGWVGASLGGAGWFLATAAYFVAFWSATGQTPGMRAVRVRVVGPSGGPPSALRSFVRFVGLILAIIPLLAGFLPVLVDGRRRGLHDFLSGTVVLDEAR
jgi:uncharacterized RDD family membrane protein YckC